MRIFLEQLFMTGQVTVPLPGSDFASGDFDAEIVRFDQAARLGMAGAAPALDLETPRWAANLLAGAARLAIARDVAGAEMERLFAHGYGKSRTASVDYSADLFLSYLPGLLAWMTKLAADDPLLEPLWHVAAAWPLSSVGIPGIAWGSIDPFIGHAGLRQLYVDRILATGDKARLNDARVTEAARAAVGAYLELSRIYDF